MSKTYTQLCAENKYLYGQLENCTLLMGKATLDVDFKKHMEYYVARMRVMEIIDQNLDLIEELWNKPVATPEEARKKKNLLRFEYRIIKAYKESGDASFNEIANKLHTSKDVVENVIIRYLKESRSELTMPA